MNPQNSPLASQFFVSYAQHGEDVLLQRALGHLPTGFYIDVGAHDPEELSVTKAFYERGWSGINIEPESTCFDRLRTERSRDVNLQLLVGSKLGSSDFFEVEGTGLSTLDASLAKEYKLRNYRVRETRLKVRTLDSILAEHAPGEIHFLKVDVEGGEDEVLRGASFRHFRPWIIVVEATKPLSSERTDDILTNILEPHNYRCVFFDGINAYYVAEEHLQLARHFDRPVNMHDRYLSSTTIRQIHEQQRLNSELEALRHSLSWRVTSPLRAVRDRIEPICGPFYRRIRKHWRKKAVLKAPVGHFLSHLHEAGDAPSASRYEFLRHPWSGVHREGQTTRLTSALCERSFLDSAACHYWLDALREPWRLHRKLWEFCFICQALYERDMLQAGRRGLGFAVGEEPLPALFASMGCEILATDLDAADVRATAWAQTSQLATSVRKLERPAICPPESFASRVTFRTVDMNSIPADLRDFDFTWSSCSFEHCGSLSLGIQFLIKQMDCLKPGGLAVHTTEFNLSSNEDTISEGGTVIFRQRDIEEMLRLLQARGYEAEPIAYTLGSSAEDKHIDSFPYAQEPHLKLLLGDQYISTSIALIIRKTNGLA